MTVGQDVQKQMPSAKVKRCLCRSAEVWMVRAPNLPVVLDVRGAACVVFVRALRGSSALQQSSSAHMGGRGNFIVICHLEKLGQSS